MNGISDDQHPLLQINYSLGSGPSDEVSGLDCRATGSAPASASLLESFLHIDCISGGSDPDHWLNHLCWLLSCFLGVKVSAVERMTACDPILSI